MSDVLDLADQAEAAEQRFRDAALSVRKPTLLACGRCHYCDTELPSGQLFCRADPGGSCRDDWQAEQDQRARNGTC